MLKPWISSEFQSDPRLLSPHANDNYRPDIDGLRAFAVLSVVLYHAFPKAVRGGYVGVDIFFVISGFLISSLLFAEMTKERFSFTTFYGRRIRRIFPALAVCLAAVLAYGFVCLTPFELAQLGKHVFFGAGFLSNIVLWSESGCRPASSPGKHGNAGPASRRGRGDHRHRAGIARGARTTAGNPRRDEQPLMNSGVDGADVRDGSKCEILARSRCFLLCLPRPESISSSAFTAG